MPLIMFLMLMESCRGGKGMNENIAASRQLRAGRGIVQPVRHGRRARRRMLAAACAAALLLAQERACKQGMEPVQPCLDDSLTFTNTPFLPL